MRQAADLVLAPSLGSWNFSDVVHSVALTLDDGPDPEVTPALIDLLDQMSVRATFFVLTLRAEDYPQLVDALVSSGHEIALHGLDHRRVSQMNFGQAFEYLKNARDRLEQVVGRSVTMYRPPYGSQSVSSVRAARRAGLQVVVWDGDAADWEDRPALDVAAAADQASTPGGILLFHERLEPDPSIEPKYSQTSSAVSVAVVWNRVLSAIWLPRAGCTALPGSGRKPTGVQQVGGVRRIAVFEPPDVCTAGDGNNGVEAGRAIDIVIESPAE
jgi:peptidoglycan/xylan/chitin deacetylase (PgdA/CDA1 family)